MHRNLNGLSADGIFKFRHAVGALAKLRPGKVMLLQGSDALMITSIGHSHGKLLVHTKAAALTDVRMTGDPPPGVEVPSEAPSSLGTHVRLGSPGSAAMA